MNRRTARNVSIALAVIWFLGAWVFMLSHYDLYALCAIFGFNMWGVAAIILWEEVKP